ncbi:hypothetical protein SX4_0637 [Vibrio mimicus SX-4]|nr:hypothetical protein SX4_0637 [Vibrio mimicus SX-4]
MERRDASIICLTAILENGESMSEMTELDKTQSQSEINTDPN